MPELPDLEYVVPQLRRELLDARVSQVRTREPIVWRLALPGTPNDALADRRFVAIERRGHFVVFTLDPARWLVANLMLAGRFRIADANDKDEASLCVAIGLGDRELRYLDDLRMGKLYVVEAGDEDRVPGLGDLGVDPISAEFTRERFRALAAKRRDQVRVFLMDKSAIASIGNAYADEILFAAKIHPKTFMRSLSGEDVDRLYAATCDVLAQATAEVRRRGAPIDEKVRDFLLVRNRKGEPCSRCGTKIRSTGVRGVDSFFCPQCQPPTRSQFVDFRKVPSTPLPAVTPPPEGVAGKGFTGERPAPPAPRPKPSAGSHRRRRMRQP